jgi:hypothetical protein
MNNIIVNVAVGVGYNFAIVPAEKTRNIKLKKTDTLVKVDDLVYPLYKGETFEESRKVDNLLDSTDVFERELSGHIVY